MLKGIDPQLNAELLYALASMGHGDDLIVADMNFPSWSVAEETVFGQLLRIDNSRAAEAIRAILTVFPVDTFVEDAAARMELVESKTEIPEVQREVQSVVNCAVGKPTPLLGVERFAFYERARSAYCVVRTGERRFYGCFAFRKGVIPPDDSGVNT